MATLGLIFSNISDKEIFEVTKDRTIASTPIGGRYRLIDFSLSSMVNNGISTIGVLTKNNYQSLMDHVGSGKDWDLARKNGGLVILPPYSTGQGFYNSRLQALKSILSFIEKVKCEYVVLTDCYEVSTIDYKPIFKQHFSTNADITVVYREAYVDSDHYPYINIIELNDESRITSMKIKKDFKGHARLANDTWIMKKSLLLDLVQKAIKNNWTSFNRDILRNNLKELKIYGYHFTGYFGNIASLQSYYKINMDLLKEEVRNELFNKPSLRIYTKVRDSAPTKYSDTATVVNSLIADGCVIEGHVQNSVLFRGTKVSKGAIVRNSILMQDTLVEQNKELNYIVTDKNVKIIDTDKLIGQEKEVIYVKKNGVL